jgi:ABC-2 type transport system permease protein
MQSAEPTDPAAGDVPPLELCYDPALPASFRSAVGNLLQLLVLSIETEERFAALGEVLPLAMEARLSHTLGPGAAGLASGLGTTMTLSPDMSPLIGLSETGPADTSGRVPDAVQQNVPAWSLFGVFFIVLPMAGSFIKERLYGLDHRFRVLPVSYLTIATGKVLAYMFVCGIQFCLITAIGMYCLPLFGLPAFEVTAVAPAVLVALCATLSATGYGILLGTALRTYEQASMFGPISVVIASAIGGIMVPVWAMPDTMQNISRLSPLCWAQNAFIDLFVRGGDIRTISDNLMGLVAFALACILIAWGIEHRRKSA